MRKNTKGAGLMEYGLIIGLVSIVAITSVATLGGDVAGIFISTSEAFDKPSLSPIVDDEGDEDTGNGGGEGGGEGQSEGGGETPPPPPPEEPPEEEQLPDGTCRYIGYLPYHSVKKNGAATSAFLSIERYSHEPLASFPIEYWFDGAWYPITDTWSLAEEDLTRYQYTGTPHTSTDPYNPTALSGLGRVYLAVRFVAEKIPTDTTMSYYIRRTPYTATGTALTAVKHTVSTEGRDIEECAP